MKTSRQTVPQVPGIPYVFEGQIIPSWVQPGQCQATSVPVPMPVQSWPQSPSTQTQEDYYKRLITIWNQLIFWGICQQRLHTAGHHAGRLWPHLAFHKFSAGALDSVLFSFSFFCNFLLYVKHTFYIVFSMQEMVVDYQSICTLRWKSMSLQLLLKYYGEHISVSGFRT